MSSPNLVKFWRRNSDDNHLGVCPPHSPRKIGEEWLGYRQRSHALPNSADISYDGSTGLRRGHGVIKTHFRSNPQIQDGLQRRNCKMVKSL